MIQKPFLFYCGIPYLNIPLMNIDDSFIPNKIYFCTPDLIPADIYVASGNYISTLDTPSDYPQVVLVSSDSNSTYHTIIIYKTSHTTEKMGYWYRWHEGIKCHIKSRYYLSVCFIHKRVYYCRGTGKIKS